MRHPLPATSSVTDDDQTTWLLTFSDLVLQLFAFVIVWALLIGPQHKSAEPPRVAYVPSPRQAPSIPSPGSPPIVVPDPPVEVIATRRLTENRQTQAAAAEVVDAPPADHRRVATAARLAALGRYFEAFIAAKGLADDASVTVTDSDMVLSLSDTIGFASGSAEIQPSALPIIQEVRTLASSMPDFGLDVAGHTDDVPIHTPAFPSNLELSLSRAAKVANALAAGDSSLRVRTVAAGFAEYRPVASNHKAQGRARNRRVEIRFVPIDYQTP